MMSTPQSFMAAARGYNWLRSHSAPSSRDEIFENYNNNNTKISIVTHELFRSQPLFPIVPFALTDLGGWI
jgi:hypothetical protein